MTDHCGDVNGDRKLGEFWEREFCKMMADTGVMLTPHQIGREASAQAYSIREDKWNLFTLPDITIWSAPGEHHEIKHKTVTKYGSYGLEEYRLQALIDFAYETTQAVYYTIHDHGGNRCGNTNRREEWVSADVRKLHDASHYESIGPSYVGGRKKMVNVWYWNRKLFHPLFYSGTDRLFICQQELFSVDADQG